MARKTTLGEQIYYPEDPSDVMKPKSTSRRFKVTEAETVALLHAGIPIEAAFGPGWMAIEWKDGQPVPAAVRQVLRMRGVSSENMHGAGI